MEHKHKSGFVNIVGNPNVGKSTLMNDLVGERISIITSKAQTTRHRIMGIVNAPEYEIVVSDTPGVLKAKCMIQESMLEFSVGALTDADILLYVTDVIEDPTKNADFVARVAAEGIPVLLVINKIDLLQSQDRLNEIYDRLRTSRHASSSPKSFAKKSCWTTTKKYPTAPKSSSKNLTRKAHRYTSWPWYMSNATAKKVSS